MKEKLWNANYIKVMTTNFLLYFAFYLLTPLLPLYLSENFGATKDVIGIVLSGYTVAALVIRPFSGYVVDSFSRKKVLMVCRLYCSQHHPDVCHLQNPSRRSVRSRNGCQQHLRHRRSSGK